MNKKTRQDVVDIIESRFDWANERFTDVLHAELEMAIDLAGVTGAIDIPEQRSYKIRLNGFVDRHHQEFMEKHGRLA